MKTIFLFLISFFSFKISSSQSLPEFAPIGSTWYYHHINLGPGFGYTQLISTDTLTIGGKFSKKISGEYLYADSLHIYYYNENKWSLLADFSKQVGDSFYVAVSSSDSFAIKILSKGDTTINGFTLPYIVTNSFHKTVKGQWIDYGGKIIHYIGAYLFLFPYPSQIDPPPAYGLRCYSDINLGIYKNPDFHFGLWSCDTVTTSIIEHNTVTNHLNFFPNPAEDKVLFNFSRKPFEEGILLISDIYGRILKKSIIRKEQTTYQFDLRNYSSGIYVYQFIDATGETSVSKFVKK